MDLQANDELMQKGTQQVPKSNLDMWRQLWQHQEDERYEQAWFFTRKTGVKAGLTPEGILQAAKAFSPKTACTDGVPPKAVALPSYELLAALASMGNVWIGSSVWPTPEQVAHVALLPKPIGGIRPIGLFRSRTRVVCKAAGWSALTWFEGQDVPQINTSKGRRIGDAIWRAQMSSYIGTKKHEGEIMIDLLKAF